MIRGKKNSYNINYHIIFKRQKGKKITTKIWILRYVPTVKRANRYLPINIIVICFALLSLTTGNYKEKTFDTASSSR